MSNSTFRLAAYSLCRHHDRLLLVQAVQPDGMTVWTLPGGRVEHGEDPIDTAVREVREETGCDVRIERLLGVDSRTISADESHLGIPHQNVGIYYEAAITRGRLRDEPNGDTRDPRWVREGDIAALRRSSLVDVGLSMARLRPATGHVDPVPVGGLIQH